MTINSTDTEKLKNNQEYQNFIKDNPGTGTLKVRTSSASVAFPVRDVEVIVSKEIGDNTIVFYEGKTDDSGMINGIKLPTPMHVNSDEEVPRFATYQLHATYSPDKFDKIYDISLCCGVSIIQYINITPNIETEMKTRYGN